MSVAFLFATAPTAVRCLVAVPGSPILLKALEFAVVDGAPFPVALGVMGGAGIVVARLTMVLFRLVAVLQKKGQGDTSFLQQVPAVFAADGDLAGKAIGGDVAGIPGSRRFGKRRFG